MQKRMMLQRQFTIQQDEVVKLSPRQFEKKSESFNFFTCTICMKVVCNPIECNKCQNAFCSDCIENWKKEREDMCPMQCEDPQYEGIHKYAMEDLESQKFMCLQTDCGLEGMTYREAISHGNRCEFNKYECQFKCGEKLLGLEMHKHVTQCPKAYIECTRCLEKLFSISNDTETHDCMAVLKSRIKTFKPFNVMAVEHANKCDHDHMLTRMSQKPSYYNGYVQCDKCQRSELENHQDFYHCSECKYDLCRQCALIPVMPYTMTDNGQKLSLPNMHDCLLAPNSGSYESGWDCDGNEKKDGCFSGIKTFHQSQFIQSFNCRECDFDLCLNCAIYYSHVKE